MSTAAERILAVIDSHGDPICDDCLSTLADVFPRQQVNALARGLADRGVLLRQERKCGMCDRFKIVNERQANPDLGHAFEDEDTNEKPEPGPGKRPPWASGPGEILRHGINLLAQDTDTNRRLAMISIDNAVELMLQTYLGLPERVNRIGLSRREFEEIRESFPRLLDAIEKHAGDRLAEAEIGLGEVEWYHRLRNQLYHQGNGLTVERSKVQIYAELARQLFSVLFGYELETVSARPEAPSLAMAPGKAGAAGAGVLPWRVQKAWFYLPEDRTIVAAVNARGSCSIRVFAAERGTAIAKKYGAGDYQENFREYLRNARPLRANRQPNLERECRDRLPEDVLTSLKSQI